MTLRRLFVLIAASAALLVSGCSIENVMFAEEPDSAASNEDITPIAKVRGQSSTSWSLEPPSALDDVLVEEARRDAIEQVPHGQVIIDPVVDMETMQIPMGLATLYSTKVFMEGTVGKTDDPTSEMKTASDHEADQHAAEDKMSDSDEPMENMAQEDAPAMKEENTEEKMESAEAKTPTGEGETAKTKPKMVRVETMKDENTSLKDAAEGLDKMAKNGAEQESEMEAETDPEKMAPETTMATMRDEKPVPPPGPPFGSTEYAEACGMQVDIPDSYGLVYVRTSKSLPLQIMSAAAYIQLLKNRCPAVVGGGS